jgi:hypothetical protein
MNQLIFIIEDIVMFIQYLKQFVVVDTNALFIINEDLTARTTSFTAARTLVKSSVLNLCECMTLIDNNYPKGMIKFGIYFVDKFIKFLDKFKNLDRTMIIFEYSLKSDGEFTGDNIIIRSDLKEFLFPCAKVELFKYMDDKVCNNLLDTSTSYLEFLIDRYMIKDVIRDCLDSKQDNIQIIAEIINDEKLITFKTKAFTNSHKIEFESNENLKLTTFSSESFKFLNKNEDYYVYITQDSGIFISLSSGNKVVFGKANVAKK